MRVFFLFKCFLFFLWIFRFFSMFVFLFSFLCSFYLRFFSLFFFLLAFLFIFFSLHSGRSKVTRVTVGRDVDKSSRVCKVNLSTLKVAINSWRDWNM